jgi:hypothetical protein
LITFPSALWNCVARDGYNPGMILRIGIRFVFTILCAFSSVNVVAAQLPSTNPTPFSKPVPSGGGACSVAKSCAEVAPDIIRRALGPSPLEKNLKFAESAGPRQMGTPATARAIAWAVQAFRIAGVDEVHTENFAIPNERGAGKNGGDSTNVVAEIRGRDLPDEFVVLGGHLDSGGKAQSVMQDAGTAAMVIDAARAIHASGSIPRRSIRFVLFTGLEQGMMGARAYTLTHRTELDHMIATIGVDGEPGRVTGYSLGGRNEILATVRDALAPLRPLDATELTIGARISPDSFDFLLEGIPTLVPNMEPADSTPAHQVTNELGPDTYDKAKIDALKHQVAIAAVAAYALSDTEGRVGSRQSRKEIEQLLKDTGLEEKMKAEGIWTEWESGKRGRQP